MASPINKEIVLTGKEFAEFWNSEDAFGANPLNWLFLDGINVQLNDWAAGGESYAIICQKMGSLTNQDKVVVRSCVMTYDNPSESHPREETRDLLCVAQTWKSRWDTRLHVTLEIPPGVSLKDLARTLASLRIPVPDSLRTAIKSEPQVIEKQKPVRKPRGTR